MRLCEKAREKISNFYRNTQKKIILKNKIPKITSNKCKRVKNVSFNQKIIITVVRDVVIKMQIIKKLLRKEEKNLKLTAREKSTLLLPHHRSTPSDLFSLSSHLPNIIHAENSVRMTINVC